LVSSANAKLGVRMVIPMASAGLLVAGAALGLSGAWMLSLVPHWFPASMLLLGIAAFVAGCLDLRRPKGSLDPAPPPSAAPAAAGPGLRDRLHELDAMLAEGTLTAAEHRRKRRQLIDAWGGPDRSG
jgi:hypothetical protein